MKLDVVFRKVNSEVQRLSPRNPVEVREREKSQPREAEMMWPVTEQDQECRILKAKWTPCFLEEKELTGQSTVKVKEEKNREWPLGLATWRELVISTHERGRISIMKLMYDSLQGQI